MSLREYWGACPLELKTSTHSIDTDPGQVLRFDKKRHKETERERCGDTLTKTRQEAADYATDKQQTVRFLSDQSMALPLARIDPQ